MHSHQVILFCIALLVSSAVSLDNGLGRTPPMGWLTWERFRCNTNCVDYPADCIGERLMLETADRMAADGWLRAGYQYITVDDCWMASSRAANGSLVADPKRFPRGMKYVVDYVHQKGLKFGIYEDFGTQTCGGFPGSEFFLSQDAATFAAWGVDLVKFDGCNSDIDQQQTGYEVFGFYLNKTGRPMVYSCSWPAYTKLEKVDVQVLQKTCNMWRMYDDIQDSWDSVLSIINFYKANNSNFLSWSGPGHWNDPDMLILGNYGLSYEQEKTQMAMWAAIFPAPLILSVDLRTISNESRAVLQHPALIRMNQDPLGRPGEFVRELNRIQLWRRQLTDSVVVALVNFDDEGAPGQFVLGFANLISKPTFTVVEVFKQKKIGTFKNTDLLPVMVNPSGGVVLLELS